MASWLLKTEPTAYALADLVREGRTRWDGVTNPQALQHLRAMRAGDGVVVYHSGEKAAAGTAKVLAGPVLDPRDPAGRLVTVEVGGARPFGRPVPLAELRALPVFAGSPLLRQGRLSVVPLGDAQWRALARLGAGSAPEAAPARRAGRAGPRGPTARRVRRP
jgi:predicted RNA-binding protein with PUA-like domain